MFMMMLLLIMMMIFISVVYQSFVCTVSVVLSCMQPTTYYQCVRFLQDRPERAIYNPARRAVERQKDSKDASSTNGQSPSSSSASASAAAADKSNSNNAEDGD